MPGEYQVAPSSLYLLLKGVRCSSFITPGQSAQLKTTSSWQELSGKWAGERERAVKVLGAHAGFSPFCLLPSTITTYVLLQVLWNDYWFLWLQ